MTEGARGSSPKRFLAKVDLAVTLGTGAVILYVLLRLPYAIFYDRLGTSPEELGLDQVRLLAEASVLVALVAAVALVPCFYILVGVIDFFLVFPKFTASRRIVGERVERLATMPDEEFRSLAEESRQPWLSNKWHLKIWDKKIDSWEVIRSLEQKRERTREEDRELKGRLKRRYVLYDEAILAYGFRIKGRNLHMWFLGSVLVILVFALPVAAGSQADRVVGCMQVTKIPGFAYGGQAVALLSSDNLRPQFADRSLYLLGQSSGTYILFDCKNDQTLRLPASDYAVVHQVEGATPA
ncbi:hypothetical protein [Arthrobacter zhaoguopingii]|uniref:hypothetical protein n=1 Tax=Arthrobacter zhaoguopingii TaxID=2681491 RepID=UPI00135B1ECA|nr:hypothetical protein [Arthrobacter zhaoguopingii]